MAVLHIFAVTRNRSICASTLHTMMNLHMLCMLRGTHIEIHFVDDMSGLSKIIKTGERLFWMDYGTSLNQEILPKVLDPFERGVQIMVFPAVREGIDWDCFEKKTKAGTKEPVEQRGLNFDTIPGKKLAPGLYESVSTSARVWVMDAKPVDKKLRGTKVPTKLQTGSPGEMFAHLASLGLKIGVASEAAVICHYVHECFGNILEAAGVELGP